LVSVGMYALLTDDMYSSDLYRYICETQSEDTRRESGLHVRYMRTQ